MARALGFGHIPGTRPCTADLPAEPAARATWVAQAYRAAVDGTAPPPLTVEIGGRAVANTPRLTRDNAAHMIADNLSGHRAPARQHPHGTRWGDSAEGAGHWPDMARNFRNFQNRIHLVRHQPRLQTRNMRETFGELSLT